MNIANKLTILRILLVPVYLVFLACNITTIDNYIAAAIFIIASLTDLFDGRLARQNNTVTDFGKFADPLADKLLTCSAFVFFVSLNMMPAWVCAVFIAREIAVSGFRLVLAANGTVLAADMSGKIKTVLQMIYIIIATLNGAPVYNWMNLSDGFCSFYNVVVIIFMYAALLLTLISMIEMFIKNRKGFKLK